MTSRTLLFFLTGSLCAAGLVAACGGKSGDHGGLGGGGNDPTGGGANGHGGDGGGIHFAGSGGGQQQAIEVTPNPTSMKVELGTAGQTIQFKAKDHGSAINASWSVNPITAGTIDSNGVFTSNGLAGGKIVVTAAHGKDQGTAKLTISLHALDNPGAVPPADQTTLEGPDGPADPTWRLVYPFDGTFFPSGTLATEIHPSGSTGAATKYYVHITASDYDYDGFFDVTPQIVMSQPAWDALGETTDGGDVKVEVAELVGGAKVGPIKQTWRVAKGKLHGTVYYNTYDSPLAGVTGAMMRIKGNSAAPEVLVGNCTVCHSVSADGSTAAAANHGGPGGIFDLSSGNVNPPNTWASPEQAAFAGLYPKGGEVFVVNGAPGPSYPPNTPGTSGTWTSSLMSKAGAVIPNSGIEPYYAQSPVFSQDGTLLAFTDRQANSPWSSTLSMMKYDAAAQKFTNYEILATPPAGRHYSWPAFTPDGKWVVYQDGVGDDLATWQANTGKIRVVNIKTKADFELTKLNGDGYLPQGARDEDLNYEPTIAPVASGGYFWIMFTSRRTYGTRLVGDRSVTKRLWVAAFDVDAADGTDPTHPAFYIPGQELASGNSRGFWALDPCKQDGNSCESGDECCNGFCNPDPQNPGSLICAPPDSSCSDEFENCTTSGDCCSSSLRCIGGKCSRITPH